MSGETSLTIQGHLTAAPELRFTAGGHAVASFSVASTPRVYDKATSAWRDGETLFMRCSAWRQLAENIAESLDKGTAVIVVGRLQQRSFEKDGQRRTVIELEADNVAASLQRATAKVTKVTAQGQPAAQQQSAGGGWGSQQPAADPWASQGSAEAPF